MKRKIKKKNRRKKTSMNNLKRINHLNKKKNDNIYFYLLNILNKN